jgi:hypothetical protein
MIPPTDTSTYRYLVQQLMARGWYRLGQGPRDTANQPTWGFREGHLLEDSHATTRWISAQDEQRAMQSLLTMLGAETGGQRKRRKSTSRASPSA